MEKPGSSERYEQDSAQDLQCHIMVINSAFLSSMQIIGFLEQACKAACSVMGEAVWQQVLADKSVMLNTITGMIIELSARCDELAACIKLTILLQV